MLVRLTSSTSGEMLIFAEHLRPLFRIIDKECTARGVITLEQLPDAIAKLQKARQDTAEQAKAKNQDKSEDGAEQEGEADVAIGLSQRAFPLIELMIRTLKDEGYILWEANGDF